MKKRVTKTNARSAVGINVDSMPDRELDAPVAPPEPAVEEDFHSSAVLSVRRTEVCLPSCPEIATRF